MASATTVAEALWLETRGVDIIIAQGYEAGGHRGTFLAQSLNSASSSQPGTLALVPQVVDAVKVPVVAAGGIADGRGIAAAFALEQPEHNSELPISSVLKQRPQNYIGMLCGMRIRTRRLLPTFSRVGLRAPYLTGLRLRLAQSSMPCPIFLCLWERWHHCGQRPNSRAAAISHLHRSEFQKAIDVNLAGFFSVTQFAVSQMLQQGSGHIVQITTSLVDQPIAGVPAALASLTKGGLGRKVRRWWESPSKETHVARADSEIPNCCDCSLWSCSLSGFGGRNRARVFALAFAPYTLGMNPAKAGMRSVVLFQRIDHQRRRECGRRQQVLSLDAQLDL